MTLDVVPIIGAVRDVASTSGLFERTAGHEPKNPPGKGITWALWVSNISPVPTDSGLAVTTARVEFTVRLYMPMLTEPQDSIDPALTQATASLMVSYSGAFTLGGLVRNIDLLGQTGPAMSARPGYASHSGTIYRIYDIALPVIVNDVFAQAP